MFFLKKLHNNNEGADLQLSVVVMLLTFSLAIFMTMDFWMASSAKIILIKEIESAEIYSLVKTVENDYTNLIQMQAGQDISEKDFKTQELAALARFGDPGGSKQSPLFGDLYDRLLDTPYINDYLVTEIVGTSGSALTTKGDFGIKTKILYNIATIIRSPESIPEMFNKEADIEITSTKTISLSVAVKMAPIIWEDDGSIKNPSEYYNN